MAEPWVVIELADDVVRGVTMLRQGKQRALELAVNVATVNTDVSRTTIIDRLESKGAFHTRDGYSVHICCVEVED